MRTLTDIEKLLTGLLRIESISGHEKNAAEYLESELAGFALRRDHVTKERFNVIARKGRSDVWFVAHMDTVPPFLPVRITADKIFGRGAIDNKGNIAGAIMAARGLKDINLLLTVGEEHDLAGARHARITGKAIVLEPTGFRKCFAQCGMVEVKLTARGAEKHSSLIGRDYESATHLLLKKLRGLLAKRWHCFNIGPMTGGVASNVVAGSACAIFSARPRDRKEFAEILKTIRAIKGMDVEVLNALPPFRSRLAGSRSSRPVSFFSELSFFRKGVLFGAGDIAQAHTPTEFILRNDLARLPRELVALARSLGSGSA